ncbi:hypothetical protein Tco_1550239 [Tanacetum coccineum]
MTDNHEPVENLGDIANLGDVLIRTQHGMRYGYCEKLDGSGFAPPMEESGDVLVTGKMSSVDQDDGPRQAFDIHIGKNSGVMFTLFENVFLFL